MTRLFIAEKPSLGQAIVDGLGGGEKKQGFVRCYNGDIVTWCFGHLLTLTDPEDYDPSAKVWKMAQLPLSWKIEHKPMGDKKAQIDLIKKLAGEASEIVNAGDPDDEGQLLVDELIEYLH